VSDPKQAWNDVADQFSDLGLKLRLHFDETVQARPDETVKKALEDLRDAVEQAFTAVGNVVKDPAVKDDVGEVARSLREALSTTFTEASADLRHCFAAKVHSPGDTPA
jgi:hypothetical protein